MLDKETATGCGRAVRVRRRSTVAILLGLLFVTPGLPLTDEEIFRDFRLNLINPGARSLALAGAFISLADDATAAQANPAGLGFLRASEYFIAARVVDNAARASIRNEVISGGADTFLATATDIDDRFSPTFVSAVTAYGRWTMGLSRQELLDISNDTLSSFALTFADSPGAFLVEGTGAIDMDVTNFNVSLGGRITDHLGVGVTLTYSRLDVDSRVENSIVDTNGGIAGVEILEPVLDTRTTIDDDDDDVVIGLGLIYKQPGKWSLGATYKTGPDFRVAQRLETGQDVFSVGSTLGNGFVNRFHLPDTYGLGGSLLLRDQRLTLAFDANRILYSNLLDDYVAGVNVLTSPDAVFTVDDVTEIRAGAELVYFRQIPFALRGGLSVEEDSTIRARSTGSASFASEEVFAGRESQLHGAVGIGVTFKRYQLDMAADFSETDNEYLISLIFKGK